MNARLFFDKVVEMRNAQKEYFRTRDKTAFGKAKELESEIDKEILRVKAILSSLPVEGETYLKKEK